MTNLDEAIPNPFTSHRFETDVHHQIWIPPEITRVSSTKLCLVSGLRGTGKTALLNCLDPLAPLRDEYRFLNPEALPRNCIGVYINILTEFTDYLPLLAAHIDLRPDSSPPDPHIYSQAFRTYLIFTSLGRSLEVIDECRRAEILQYSAQAEGSFVTGFQNLWRKHFTSTSDERAPRSILDCASALFKICMAIRINSVRLYPDRVEKIVGAVHISSLYREFCTLASRAGILEGKQGAYHVKISLDDVHRFGRHDQILLNGVVEIAAAPFTWNLSFVTGRYDPSLSIDPEVPLTRHDVERVDLNYEHNPKGFKELCRKLYNMRLGIADRNADDSSTGYAKVLGNPPVSILFNELVRETASTEFKQRISRQLEYVAGQLFRIEREAYPSRPGRHVDGRKFLYHAYIFNTLFGASRERFEAFLKERTPLQTLNYFRQKNVAALVCAANELGRQTPYAGTNVLISLSDGCVRDFLRILAHLYDNSTSGVHRRRRTVPRPNFFSPTEDRAIPLEEQSRSFVQASQGFIEQIDEATDRIGRVLANITNNVAELTRLLQSKDRVKALSAPERGHIRVNFAELTLLGEATNEVEILRRALALGQYTGSIRLMQGIVRASSSIAHTDQIVFRLHRLTAPYYRYSSRGPLRIVHVPLPYFLEFATERSFATRDWPERVFDAVNADSTDDRNASTDWELFS